MFRKSRKQQQEEDVPPVIRQALQSLQTEDTSTMPAPVIAISFPSQGLGGGVLVALAKQDPRWNGLELAPTTAALRLLGAHFVLAGLEDPGLRTYFSDWLDCKPSEVDTQVWSSYRDTFLSTEDAALADGAMQRRADGDRVGYASDLFGLVAAAAGQPDQPGGEAAAMWPSLLDHYQTSLVPEVRSDVRATLAKYEQYR